MGLTAIDLLSGASLERDAQDPTALGRRFSLIAAEAATLNHPRNQVPSLPLRVWEHGYPCFGWELRRSPYVQSGAGTLGILDVGARPPTGRFLPSG